ncbi:HSPE1 [Cordylochernes scorpioides]|uniref:10 kDa heat shock protein, mitochondrial n=1 Tax=Cordylochernes scorpioides TaxID=51811 RepID=A0ABY6LA08_9ARAC|nr:HSPE1 [Cordylochernes scorpioides]
MPFSVYIGIQKFLPLLDRVLVQRLAAETKTKGRIIIPEKAQHKVHTAYVVAVGQGYRTQKGDIVPLSLKEGDKVLLPEFGGTKVEIEDKEYYLFKDSDILGKWSDNSSH